MSRYHKFLIGILTCLLSFILISPATLLSASFVKKSPMHTAEETIQPGISPAQAPQTQPRLTSLNQPPPFNILKEDFESGLIPPDQWSSIITHVVCTWANTKDRPHNGGFGAQCLFDQELYEQNEWLITPPINLSVHHHDIFLSFWWQMDYKKAVEDNTSDFNCKISVDNGTTWSLLWNEDTIGCFISDTWYDTTLGTPINLSAFGGAPEILLGFQYIGVNGSSVYLDDITLYVYPEIDVAVSQLLHPESSLTAHREGVIPRVSVINNGKESMSFGVNFSAKKVGYRTSGVPWDFESDNGSFIHRVGPNATIPSDLPPHNQTDKWQWGIPTYVNGPNQTHSGQNCWGTNLSGVLDKYANMFLVTPPLNISYMPNAQPQLRFYHWYNFFIDKQPKAREGGNLKVSTNNGMNWTLIYPVGGYPYPYVSRCYGINMEPAYSNNTNNTWRPAVFDLSAYVNQTILIAFHCGSTIMASGKKPGWYIDDVALTYYGLWPEYQHMINITLESNETQELTFPQWLFSDWLIGYNEVILYNISIHTILPTDQNDSNDILEKQIKVFYPFLNDVGIKTITHPTGGTQNAQVFVPEVSVCNYGQMNQTTFPTILHITKAEERFYYLQEDFENGLPLTWSVVDGGNSTHTWSDENPEQREGKGGCQGIFMMVDSHTAGAPPPPFPPTYLLNESLISPTLDLRAASNVHLTFSQYYKNYFDDVAEVDVSTDEGQTWNRVAFYNNTILGPTTLDISAFAAGCPQVKIRWLYNDSACWAYYWMVDNIQIYSLIASDVLEYNHTCFLEISENQTASLTFPEWIPEDITRVNVSIIYYTLCAYTNLLSTGIPDENIKNNIYYSQLMLRFIQDVGIVSPRQTVFTESFEEAWVPDSSGDLAPPLWENHITDQTFTEHNKLPHHWGQYSTVTSWEPDATPVHGMYQAVVQCSFDFKHQDEWLITPPIDLKGYDAASLNFWWYGHAGSQFKDHYYVKLSPSRGYEKNNFTTILWDATTLYEADNQYETSIQIDLSGCDGTSFRLAWENKDSPAKNGMWYSTALDNITITGEPIQTYSTIGQKTITTSVKNYGTWYHTFFITATIYNLENNECLYTSTCMVDNLSASATQTVVFDPWTVDTIGYYLLNISINSSDDLPLNNKWAKHITVDTTPPETTCIIEGSPGPNNWYTNPISITFEAVDTLTQIRNIYYKLNDGQWTIYDAPLVIASDGYYSLSYYSVDLAGNSETVQTTLLKIDQTPPALILKKERLGFCKLFFIADTTDEPSGISHVEFYLDGQLQLNDSQAPYEWAWSGIGNYSVTAISYDNAGNQIESSETTEHSTESIYFFKNTSNEATATQCS